RKSFVSINEVLHSQQVPGRAQAGDHTHSRRSRHGAGAEAPVRARVQVRQVDLHDRRRQRLQTIVESDRVVGECRRVDDDAGGLGPLAVQVLDDPRLRRGLEEVHLHAARSGALPHLALDVAQGLGAVDVRLADAQAVEIRAVDHQDPHSESTSTPGRSRRRRGWGTRAPFRLAALGTSPEGEGSNTSVTTSSTSSAGTARPVSARPRVRGSTQPTVPLTAFLSRGIAASTSATLTRWSLPGSPYAASSSSCWATRPSLQRPVRAASRAATRMPTATARPWGTL